MLHPQSGVGPSRSRTKHRVTRSTGAAGCDIAVICRVLGRPSRWISTESSASQHLPTATFVARRDSAARDVSLATRADRCDDRSVVGRLTSRHVLVPPSTGLAPGRTGGEASRGPGEIFPRDAVLLVSRASQRLTTIPWRRVERGWRSSSDSDEQSEMSA